MSDETISPVIHRFFTGYFTNFVRKFEKELHWWNKETISPVIHWFFTGYFTNFVSKLKKKFHRWSSETCSPVFHRLRISHPSRKYRWEWASTNHNMPQLSYVELNFWWEAALSVKMAKIKIIGRRTWNNWTWRDSRKWWQILSEWVWNACSLYRKHVVREK